MLRMEILFEIIAFGWNGGECDVVRVNDSFYYLIIVFI